LTHLEKHAAILSGNVRSTSMGQTHKHRRRLWGVSPGTRPQ